MGNSSSSSAGTQVDIATSGNSRSSGLTSGTSNTKSQQLGILSGKPICCVCKETKAARDECVVRNGEERCTQFINAHDQCLRMEGFDVLEKASNGSSATPSPRA